MPRISDFMTLYQPELPIISIRKRTPVESLPKLIGESYAKLAAYLHDQQGMMTDVPFVIYHNMDMQDLDVEMAFPVNTLLTSQGDINARTMAATQVVCCLYLGPYHNIEPTYHDMMNWITEQGLALADAAYEFYYNDQKFDESQYLTKIVMPVK